jgi:hypothetical protein
MKKHTKGMTDHGTVGSVIEMTGPYPVDEIGTGCVVGSKAGKLKATLPAAHGAESSAATGLVGIACREPVCRPFEINAKLPYNPIHDNRRGDPMCKLTWVRIALAVILIGCAENGAVVHRKTRKQGWKDTWPVGE